MKWPDIERTRTAGQIVFFTLLICLHVLSFLPGIPKKHILYIV